MKFIVLADPQDETALRVGAALRRRHGRQPVRIVSTQALAMAPVFVHRLTRATSGSLLVETLITLPEGDVLDFSQPGVIFNRLELTLPLQFASASPSDRDYAVQELNAAWMSMLHGLKEAGWAVVNPVTGRGLNARPSELEWARWAAPENAVDDERWTLDQRNQTEERGNQDEGDQPTAIRLLAAGDRIIQLLHPVTDSTGSSKATSDIGPSSNVSGGLCRRATSILRRLQSSAGIPLLAADFQFYRSAISLKSVDVFPHFSEPDAVQAVADYLSDLA